MTYTIYQAAGWHGEPENPVIDTTDDELEAAMRAGCRADIGMPGNCNSYDAYAIGEDGTPVEPIESFCCERCGKIVAWGEHGPTGTMDGTVLECAGAVEKHLITWVCDACADEMD